MVNPALKQRLLQEFQQKQQQESLAAQASRAAAVSEVSEERPRSSNSKGAGVLSSPTDDASKPRHPKAEPASLHVSPPQQVEALSKDALVVQEARQVHDFF